MKIKKITFIFIYFAFLSSVFADLRIKNWSQENIFTYYGQEVDIAFDLEAENLEKNYYHYSWGFNFDKKQKINIIEVSSSDGKKVDYTFGDNQLRINFDKLFNQQSIKLKIKYNEINDEIKNIPYIRRESVDIPNFAAGANATLLVKTIKDLDIYSLNEKFKKNIYDYTYNWSGIVDKKGFYDVFEMTQKEAKWEVFSQFTFSGNRDLKNIKAEIPLNFAGGNNKIIKYQILTNQEKNNINFTEADLILDKDKYINIDFKNFYSKKIIITIKAMIQNNYNNFYWMNDFTNKEITDINQEYISTFSSLVNQILAQDKTNLPSHIKIAKWVHDNITYNINYVGKKMTSMEILNEKIGVCEHYAILYQDLLRSVGIAAKTISGISYSFDKKKFENHAWVMVNYNSQWIPIDPTWGIYSGKLPISHIFLYNDVRNGVKFSYYDKIEDTKIDIDNGAKFLLN